VPLAGKWPVRTALHALFASVLVGQAFAQDAPLRVMVDDRTYVVTGTAVQGGMGNEPSDDTIVVKARFTARVLDEEILNSEDNKQVYSAANRAAVFADAASKDWVEPWRMPLLQAATAPGSGVAEMVAGAQALAEAKRAFTAWIARLANNPREFAVAIARRDYLDGMRAFRENSAIYRKVTVKNGILTYEEALRFQRNQLAILRMAYARALEEQLQRGDSQAIGPAKDGDAAKSPGNRDQAAADGQSQSGQDATSLKQKLDSEVGARVEQDVKTVADLESKFDDMRRIVESDASGIEQHRELREYMKSTANLGGSDNREGSRPTDMSRGGPNSSGPSAVLPGPWPAIDLRPSQRLIRTFANARATPTPRYRRNPIVVANAHRPVVWPKGTNPPRQSTITGLDRERVTGRYQPITRTQAQNVVGRYRSIPGGITLEGGSPDLGFIKTVAYLPDPNAFLLNDDIVYLNPVTADEFLQIARALAVDEKMGVSIGSISIEYGELPPQSAVARNLRLADSFLGGIAFGEATRARGYVFAPGFQAVRSVTGGNIAVYFNIHDYRFYEEPSGELRRDGLSVDVTLVPLSSQKAADGGHGPDFERIEKGDVPAPFISNVKHLQSNLDYYGRERIVRTTFAYGEIAAFARALKENGVRMGAQAR
jgi:hypothetical protein